MDRKIIATRRNPFFRFSKLSEARFLSLLECFAEDRTATETARITGISLRSVNAIFLRLRRRLAGPEAEDAQDVPEADPFGRVHLLGLREREGRVQAEWVPASVKALLPDLRGGASVFQCLVTREEWPGYQAIGDLDGGILHRVHPACVGDGAGEEDPVGAFWVFLECRLRRFHGIPARTLWLHVKESELRFNHRDGDLLDILAGLLKDQPL